MLSPIIDYSPAGVRSFAGQLGLPGWQSPSCPPVIISINSAELTESAFATKSSKDIFLSIKLKFKKMNAYSIRFSASPKDLLIQLVNCIIVCYVLANGDTLQARKCLLHITCRCTKPWIVKCVIPEHIAPSGL